jgi:uncharacterized protein YccT (UPF0319 family)
MNKKYVEITTNLPKGMVEDPVIGTEVKHGDDVIGSVTAYNKETGEATLKIKAAVWKKIASENNGQLKEVSNEVASKD